jgi:hypothetical protein
MSRVRLSQFFSFYIILVLVTLVIGWIVATMVYWSNRPGVTVGGRMLARYEWPESLVKLLGDADKMHIQVEQLSVYSGPHDTYYWKCNATPGLLDLMIARWKDNVWIIAHIEGQPLDW